jgi:hypothetical protein
MTGLEFINIDDNGELEEILRSIQIDFVAEKFCKIPDTDSLYSKMEDLILSFGYGDVDINDIAREAAEILGMKKKK